MVTVVSTLAMIGLLAGASVIFLYYCWLTQNWNFLGVCALTAVMMLLIMMAS